MNKGCNKSDNSNNVEKNIFNNCNRNDIIRETE